MVDLLVDSHNSLNRWKIQFRQLLNVHRVDVRQKEMHATEPFVPEPRFSEYGIPTENLERYISSGIDHIPAERIQAGGNILRSEKFEVIDSVWNKEELPCQWKESVVEYIYEKGYKTEWGNYRGISLLPTTYDILSKIFVSRFNIYVGIITGSCQREFQRNRSTTDQLLCFRQIL
jgi:hypothetical protein